MISCPAKVSFLAIFKLSQILKAPKTLAQWHLPSLLSNNNAGLDKAVTCDTV